jgi:aspartate kinase
MEETCKRVKLYVEPLLREKIIVFCGFLGRDLNGNVTTLGRGGSDTTAIILANCLEADETILVKETEGVMSADPMVVPNARPLKKIDIHEMFALSFGGAKVIKAEALKYKIPKQKLRILKFSNGINSKGTEVTGEFNSHFSEIIKKKGLSSVSVVCDINPKNVSKILAIFGNRSIYGISTGKVSLTVFTSSEDLNDFINELHRLDICKALSYRSDLGLIEISHPKFVNSPGWVARVSGALASQKINIIEITTSKSTINLFIDEFIIEDAVKVIKNALET